MKIKKSLIITLIVLVALAVGLTACVKNDNIPEYKYPYNILTNISPDEGMAIDGILDESVYNGKSYMNFSQSNVECKITTHFGEKGLYVGAVIRDSYIYYNAPYNMNANTSVEVFICSENKTALDANVIQIAVDTQNKWASTYVAFLGTATVQGNDVNTGNSDGMTAEFFIPWSEIGLENVPEKVKIFPGFNHVAALGATNGLKIRPVGNVNKPINYYLFNTDGYINADSATALLGDSVTGISKSCGWDINGLNGDNQTVRSTEDDAQFIFFKGINSDKYLIEATITPIAILRGNKGPKVGVMIGYDGNPMSYTSTYNQKSGFMFDISSSYFTQNAVTADKVNAKVMNFFNTGWVTTDFVYFNNKSLENGGLNYEDGVKMKVIKYNETFFYYVNDMLVYINQIDYLKNEAMPGLFTIGCEAVFSDMNVIEYGNNEKGLIDEISKDAYIVSVENNDGGTVSTSAVAVIKNIDSSLMVIDNNIELTILPDSGNEVAEFSVNGTDKLADAKVNMREGVYKINGVNSDINIKVNFGKIESSTLASIKTYVVIDSGTQNPSYTTLTVMGKYDKTVYYTPKFNLTTIDGQRKGVATIKLPIGEYLFRYMFDGFVTQTVEVDVTNSGLFELDTVIMQTRSEYGTNVSGNYDGNYWKLTTKGDIDYTEEEKNTVRLGDNSNFYFSKVSAKSIVKTRISNVTKAEGKKDEKAGIIIAGYIHNGIETKYSIVVDNLNNDIKLLIQQTGQNNNWSYFKPLNIDITNDTGAELAIVRDGINVYIFINDTFVNSINIGLTEETAVGFITVGSKAVFNEFEYLTDFSEQSVEAEFNRLMQKI